MKAQKRLASYSEMYKNKFNLINDELSTTRILPVVYVDSPSGVSTASSLVLYKCDFFENLNYAKGDKIKLKTYDKVDLGYGFKNYYVADDCSKFVTAVYYHYLSKNKYETSDLSLLYIGSSKYISHNSAVINALSNNDLFTLYTKSDIEQYLLNKPRDEENMFSELCVGDMIYRPAILENNVVKIPAHVEFYIGNNSVISWGRIHSEYFINKKFRYNNGVYRSSSSLDFNQPYTHIVRFNGDKNEKK